MDVADTLRVPETNNKTLTTNTHYKVKCVSDCSEQTDINSPIEYEKLESSQKSLVVTWIKENFEHRKSINYRHSSYELKHIFERSHDGFYITNGAFKGALLAAGFTNHNDGMNWYFAITERSIKESKKGGRW
jgi:hypothetical protein